MQKNPDFRFNRMRKSGKTSFLSTYREGCYHTFDNSVVRDIPNFLATCAHAHLTTPNQTFTITHLTHAAKCKPMYMLNLMLFAQKISSIHLIPSPTQQLSLTSQRVRDKKKDILPENHSTRSDQFPQK